MKSSGEQYRTLLQHAIKVARRVRRKESRAILLLEIAGTCLKKGFADLYEELFLEVLGSAESSTPEQKAFIIAQAAYARALSGQIEKSEQLFQDALRAAAKLSTVPRYSVLFRMAEFYTELGWFNSVANLAETVDDVRWRSTIYSALVSGYIKKGDLVSALDTAQKMTEGSNKATGVVHLVISYLEKERNVYETEVERLVSVCSSLE